MSKVLILLLLCATTFAQNRACSFGKIVLSEYNGSTDEYVGTDSSFMQVTVVIKDGSAFWFNLDREAVSESMFFLTYEHSYGITWGVYRSAMGHKLYIDDLCMRAFYFDPNLLGLRLTFKQF